MEEPTKFIIDNFEDFKNNIATFNSKVDTKDKIDLTKLIINDYELKSSSGTTDLYIYKNAKIVIKHFNTVNNKHYQTSKITEETDIIVNCDSKYINKVLAFEVGKQKGTFIYSYIIYKYYEPITTDLIKKFDLNNLKGFLKGVSEALFDIHSKDFIHGDVGVTNIGQDTDKRYILLDTENLKKSYISEKKYQDVEEFLDNVEVNSNETNKLFIKQILDRMKTECCITETITRQMFKGGPLKQIEINTGSKYENDSFKKILYSVITVEGLKINFKKNKRKKKKNKNTKRRYVG